MRSSRLGRNRFGSTLLWTCPGGSVIGFSHSSDASIPARLHHPSVHKIRRHVAWHASQSDLPAVLGPSDRHPGSISFVLPQRALLAEHVVIVLGEAVGLVADVLQEAQG